MFFTLSTRDLLQPDLFKIYSQKNFFVFENVLVLFYHPFHICLEKLNWSKLTKILPLSKKSMNPIQTYPHIIELFACIL